MDSEEITEKNVTKSSPLTDRDSATRIPKPEKRERNEIIKSQKNE